MCCRGATICNILPMVLAPFVFLFSLIGLVSSSWITASGGVGVLPTLGLWGVCFGICAPFPIVPGFLVATRLFVVLGFIASFVAIIITGVHMCKPDSRPLTIISIVLPALIGFFNLIGAIVFAASFSSEIGELIDRGGLNKLDYSLDWGFGMCLTDALLAFIMIPLLVIHEKKKQ